eukprot:1412780-Pleurochrysis_carterae.AAC.2
MGDGIPANLLAQLAHRGNRAIYSSRRGGRYKQEACWRCVTATEIPSKALDFLLEESLRL